MTLYSFMESVPESVRERVIRSVAARLRIHTYNPDMDADMRQEINVAWLAKDCTEGASENSHIAHAWWEAFHAVVQWQRTVLCPVSMKSHRKGKIYGPDSQISFENPFGSEDACTHAFDAKVEQAMRDDLTEPPIRMVSAHSLKIDPSPEGASALIRTDMLIFLVCNGLTNNEIAAALRCHQDTVRDKVKRLIHENRC